MVESTDNRGRRRSPRHIGIWIAAAVVAMPVLRAQDGTGATPAAGALVQSFAAIVITEPPAALGLDAFYRKYTDAFGVPIIASDKVPDAALLVARDIVNYMLLGRPDVRAEMIEQGYRVGVMAETEMTTDLPEQRDWRKPARNDRRLTTAERRDYDEPGGIGSMTDREYWNRRARGMGGRYTTCAEENLLGYPGTPYFGENILVHEFSHGIMHALQKVEPALYREVQAAYRDARRQGRFAGHYAETTADEYWAEGSQWWFGSNYAWRDGERWLRDADDLKAYDPVLHGLLARVYAGQHIPADVHHGRSKR